MKEIALEKNLRIEELDTPEWQIIGGEISQYNTQQAGEDHAKNLCFVVKSSEDEIVGGVIGTNYWDWFSLELMWVREDLRGQGYGTQLLTLAEEKARDRGAKQVCLDTFSFQAPEFYKKFGYEVFGVLDHFPNNHKRYYMTKNL